MRDLRALAFGQYNDRGDNDKVVKNCNLQFSIIIYYDDNKINIDNCKFTNDN